MAVGCTTTSTGAAGTQGSARPAWIGSPKTDDSVYMYRVGYGEGVTPLGARDAAVAAAAQQLQQELSGVAGRAIFLPAGAVTILPGCNHTEPHGRGYRTWLQVSFPQTKKQELLQP